MPVGFGLCPTRRSKTGKVRRQSAQEPCFRRLRRRRTPQRSLARQDRAKAVRWEHNTGPCGYRAPSGARVAGRGLGGFAQVCRCALVVVVTGTLVRAAQAAEPDANLAAALEAARALERWGSARGWLGPDPYDALNARWLPRITRRSPLALRVVTQAVKRSPLNLRPILGIPDGLSAATLAHVISAYARNGFLDAQEAHAKLRRCIDSLAALRCTAFPEPCWGYHFDVQTRVFFYPRTSPNTIATAFAGLGLLDAYELAGDDGARARPRRGRLLHPPCPADREWDRGLLRLPPRRHHPDTQRQHAGCALLARLAALSTTQDFAEPRRGDGDTRSPSAAGRRLAIRRSDRISHGSTAFTPATCWTACSRVSRHRCGGETAERAWRRGVFAITSSVDRTGRHAALHPPAAISDRCPMRSAGDPDAFPSGTARA